MFTQFHEVQRFAIACVLSVPYLLITPGRDLRKAAKKIKTDGAPLTEQVGEQLNALRSTVSELLNLVDAFEESSGKKHEASSGSLEGCKTLEIRDGRLVVDLAPNSGVVAFVDRG